MSSHPWSLLQPSNLLLCPELWFQLESFIHQLQTGPPSKLQTADPGPSEAADALAPALHLCQLLLLSFLSPAPVLSHALWLFFMASPHHSNQSLHLSARSWYCWSTLPIQPVNVRHPLPSPGQTTPLSNPSSHALPASFPSSTQLYPVSFVCQAIAPHPLSL